MKTLKYHSAAFVCCALAAVIILTLALKLFADPPQPVLSISSLGTNQVLITVTNAVSTNYNLYWTPTLSNPGYPWTITQSGALGQSNFTVTIGGTYSAGFYRVAIPGGSGVPPWEAADPSDPNSPILSVFITYPLDGSVVQ